MILIESCLKVDEGQTTGLRIPCVEKRRRCGEMRYLLCLSSELSVNVLCFQYDMRTVNVCVFSMICSDMRDDMCISCSDMRDDMRSGA